MRLLVRVAATRASASEGGQLCPGAGWAQHHTRGSRGGGGGAFVSVQMCSVLVYQARPYLFAHAR